MHATSPTSLAAEIVELFPLEDPPARFLARRCLETGLEPRVVLEAIAYLRDGGR